MLQTALDVRLPDWVRPLADPRRAFRTDEERMSLAVALARENVLRGTGGPFGAAVFDSRGALVSAGVNLVVALHNSALHAEVLALMLAEARLRSHTLRAPGRPAHELFTSCEPCAMCLGAVLWAGVRRVVCGAARADASAAGFEEGPVFPESYSYLEARGVSFTRGVLAGEARAVLDLYRRRGGPVYNG
jgi:tRNA(Arg) A34 adenosine deaminase TadA